MSLQNRHQKTVMPTLSEKWDTSKSQSNNFGISRKRRKPTTPGSDGKSLVESVNYKLQQWWCSINVNVVAPQLVQSGFIPMFITTQLPADAYHELQNGHEVRAAHVAAVRHRVAETVESALGIDVRRAVVVNSSVRCNDSTQCRCHLYKHKQNSKKWVLSYTTFYQAFNGNITTATCAHCGTEKRESIYFCHAQNGQQNTSNILVTLMTSQMCSWTIRSWQNSSSPWSPLPLVIRHSPMGYSLTTFCNRYPT